MTCPEPLTDEELAAIEELAQAAAPGPWFVRNLDDDHAMNLVAISTPDTGCSERSRKAQMTAWLSDQRTEFESLAGRIVAGWRGVEMALRESTPTGPQFSDPGAPCLQLAQLEVTLDTTDHRTIDTYQDDTTFGLRVAASVARRDRKWDGIYRQRELDLPVGRIDAVTTSLDEGTLAEVTLSIGQMTLLLIAAEIYESNDGSLEWHRFDESVMVFAEPTEADKIEWLPPRPSSRQRP